MQAGRVRGRGRGRETGGEEGGGEATAATVKMEAGCGGLVQEEDLLP